MILLASHPALRRLVLALVLGPLLVLYGLAYRGARRAHLLVHHQTCTGGPSGSVVDTHRVASGDPGIPIFWSTAQRACYFAAPYVFFPAILIEQALWYAARPAGSSCRL
jgi:hypothetical protein